MVVRRTTSGKVENKYILYSLLDSTWSFSGIFPSVQIKSKRGKITTTCELAGLHMPKICSKLVSLHFGPSLLPVVGHPLVANYSLLY